MKRVLLLIMLAAAVFSVNAQVLSEDSAATIVKEKGVFEQKKVVYVDSVKASTLYRRAMEALSDWTGTDGRSRAGLDYCDKEEGLVTYKGEFYNGYRKLLLGTLPFYTDFTLKVRCKDGRAQVIVTVPTMHTVLNNGKKRTWTVREIVDAQESTTKKAKEKAKNKTNAISMREVVNLLLENMESALKQDKDEDF
ncbi:MAG: DUF4468 domain-containing protein [Prevotella sp.]|nr:DUF4468 domain-containing protein [Prevotella sp.]